MISRRGCRTNSPFLCSPMTMGHAVPSTETTCDTNLHVARVARLPLRQLGQHLPPRPGRRELPVRVPDPARPTGRPLLVPPAPARQRRPIRSSAAWRERSSSRATSTPCPASPGSPSGCSCSRRRSSTPTAACVNILDAPPGPSQQKTYSAPGQRPAQPDDDDPAGRDAALAHPERARRTSTYLPAPGWSPAPSDRQGRQHAQRDLDPRRDRPLARRAGRGADPGRPGGHLRVAHASHLPPASTPRKTRPWRRWWWMATP